MYGDLPVRSEGPPTICRVYSKIYAKELEQLAPSKFPKSLFWVVTHKQNLSPMFRNFISNIRDFSPHALSKNLHHLDDSDVSINTIIWPINTHLTL